MIGRNDNDPHRYDDIIHLPHPVSPTRPQMPPEDRAAIFSPFAALTGHDARIRETARLTSRRVTLSESEKELLDEKLRDLQAQIAHACSASGHPHAEFLCYMPDALKDGGSYERISGAVKKIDAVARNVVFYAENGVSNGFTVAIDDIVGIEIL